MTCAEDDRIPRPPRPTWQSLMSPPPATDLPLTLPTDLTLTLQTLEAQLHAIDAGDIGLMTRLNEDALQYAKKVWSDPAAPKAYGEMIKSAHERSKHRFDTWRREFAGMRP